MVEIPPKWFLNPWPPTLTSNPDSDLLVYALARLKTVFDFAAQLADGSASDLKSEIASHFASITSQQSVVTKYKRLPVDAAIWEDGSATWGYDIPAAGSFPGDLEEFDLDVFIKNWIRYDLQKRIESI
ncbi:MAG: hypothetical protein ACREQE_01200 [Candidatus Binataceae bacterium]